MRGRAEKDIQIQFVGIEIGKIGMCSCSLPSRIFNTVAIVTVISDVINGDVYLNISSLTFA